MASFRKKLLNRSLEMGMTVMQKALGHPTVGPMLMRSAGQVLQLRETLEDSRQQLLSRMQIASSAEQADLRDQIEYLERKLERVERRMRELSAREREARREAAAAQARLEANQAIALSDEEPVPAEESKVSPPSPEPDAHKDAV